MKASSISKSCHMILSKILSPVLELICHLILVFGYSGHCIIQLLSLRGIINVTFFSAPILYFSLDKPGKKPALMAMALTALSDFEKSCCFNEQDVDRNKCTL